MHSMKDPMEDHKSKTSLTLSIMRNLISKSISAQPYKNTNTATTGKHSQQWRNFSMIHIIESLKKSQKIISRRATPVNISEE